jgi:hypothetical protein
MVLPLERQSTDNAHSGVYKIGATGVPVSYWGTGSTSDHSCRSANSGLSFGSCVFIVAGVVVWGEAVRQGLKLAYRHHHNTTYPELWFILAYTGYGGDVILGRAYAFFVGMFLMLLDVTTLRQRVARCYPHGMMTLAPLVYNGF